jgi:hypothetical protein
VNNQQLFLIIIALLAIIPASVAFIVLWSRMVAQDTRINAALGGKEDIIRIENEQKDVNIRIVKLENEIVGLKESFASLSNKMNSRLSREKKTEKENDNEDDGALPRGITQEDLFKPQNGLAFPLDKQRYPNSEQPRRMIMRTKQG